MQKRKLELLCPAGDLTRLKAAVDFGADAVYLAGEEFGMRTAAKNFSIDKLHEGIKYAHDKGAAVHVTCNTLPHEDEMARLPEFIRDIADAGADAVIACDLGIMEMVKNIAPEVELHVSVQSGVVNSATANVFNKMGAKRIVLARELSIEEIAKIRAATPPELELEAFVHGAMCVSFSARCLLSSYMTGRDANRGDCAQPCRWSYSLMEQKRTGQLFDITDNEKGTYILNANDLCMAEHIDKLCSAGVNSLKIEGRAKSHYYTAVITSAYRGAVDEYLNNPDSYKAPDWVMAELEKISHRTYSTGFYFGRPENAQTYKDAGYIRDYMVAGVVTGYENGRVQFRLKNKFLKGQVLDCLPIGAPPFIIVANEMFNEKGEAIDTAPHPERIVQIPFEREIPAGSLLRMKSEE